MSNLSLPHLQDVQPLVPPTLVSEADARAPFTLLDVSQAASRELHVATESPELGILAGRLLLFVNQQPEFRKSGLDGAAFRTMLLNNLTPEIARLLDPAQAARIKAEQEKTNPAAQHPGVGAAAGFRLVNGVLVREGDRSDGTANAAAAAGRDGSTQGITAANYGSSAFAKTGLSYSAFDAMRREGFNGAQINAAVETNRGLGLGPNDNPAATARLQRDTPWAIPGLYATHDNWKQVHDLDEQEKAARAKGDTAKADEIKKRAQEARRKAEEHDRQQQDKMRGRTPKRLPDLIDRQRAIKHAVISPTAELTPGNENKTHDNLRTIDAHRRNPTSPTARRNYDALREAAKHDPQTRAAWAKIERGLKRDVQLKAGQVATNEAGWKKGNEGLDLLNETETPTPAAKIEPPKKAADADARGKPKPASKPHGDRKKVAGAADKATIARAKPTAPVA